MRSRQRLLTACLIVAVSVLPSGAALACPMCWAGLSHSAEGMKMAAGFQSGILFLMITPFLIAGVIGFRLYRAYAIRDSEFGIRNSRFFPSPGSRVPIPEKQGGL